MRPLLLLALCAVTLAAADKPAPRIGITELPPPAGPHALGATLVTAPGGRVWLTWVEPPGPVAPKPAGSHGHAAAAPAADAPPNTLRFATYDPRARTWSAAGTIVRGHGVTTSSGDFPQLAVDGRGHAVAIWTDGRGGAQTSRSEDNGATWSAPQPWNTTGDEVEKFALATLADGRVVAAWLDGRRKRNGATTQALYARVLGQSGPDTLVDDSVCECCQTTLTAFPDGGALLAYRGRTTEEVRDIRTARLRGGVWSEPRTLSADDWRLTACPMNGPQLASDGGRVAAAWFTAADNTPRVLASFSPDAGGRFMMPLRIDRGRGAGYVDTLLLHDGAMLVTWIEADGSLWLRRVSPDYSPDEAVLLAPATAGRVKGFPRSVLLRDYTGGKTSAQFLVAFTQEGAPGTIRTLLVDVPEGELLEAQKNCDCAPTAEELQGFAVRGAIAEVRPGGDRVRVKHFEVPGLLGDGTSDFRVAPATAPALVPGRQFLGRIEQRGGEWWLFDVRLLTVAP